MLFAKRFTFFRSTTGIVILWSIGFCKTKKTSWWAQKSKPSLSRVTCNLWGLLSTSTNCCHRSLSLYLPVSVSPISCPVHTSYLIRRANVSLDLTVWHWAKARANHDYRSEASASRWNADKKQRAPWLIASRQVGVFVIEVCSGISNESDFSWKQTYPVEAAVK